jgi:hypothetical protein
MANDGSFVDVSKSDLLPRLDAVDETPLLAAAKDMIRSASQLQSHHARSIAAKQLIHTWHIRNGLARERGLIEFEGCDHLVDNLRALDPNEKIDCYALIDLDDENYFMMIFYRSDGPFVGLFIERILNPDGIRLAREKQRTFNERHGIVQAAAS